MTTKNKTLTEMIEAAEIDIYGDLIGAKITFQQIKQVAIELAKCVEQINIRSREHEKCNPSANAWTNTAINRAKDILRGV